MYEGPIQSSGKRGKYVIWTMLGVIGVLSPSIHREIRSFSVSRWLFFFHWYALFNVLMAVNISE